MRSALKDADMGRPRTKEPRNQQLNFSLTQSELESITRRAEAVGLRPVHFGRALLLASNNSPSVSGTGEDNRSHLVYDQLRRLGNNLNQLMRHMHRTGDTAPADLEPLLVEIRHILARRGRDDR